MFKRIVLLAAVALIGTAAFVAHAETKTDPVVASAQILVVPGARTEKPTGEDYMVTQLAVLRSDEVAKRASETKALKALPQFAGPDGRTKLRQSFTVARTPADGNVITLNASGVTPEVGVAILDGVIQGYQAFLNDKYRTQRDLLTKSLDEARAELEKAVDSKEAELIHHRFNSNPLRSSARIEKEVDQRTERLSQSAMRQTELRARIEFVQSAAQDAALKDALHDRVSEWATRTGVAKNEATEARYLNYLKFELREAETIHRALMPEADHLKGELKRAEADDLEESKIRRELSNKQNLYLAVVSKINQMDMAKTGGFEIVAISAPAALK